MGIPSSSVHHRLAATDRSIRRRRLAAGVLALVCGLIVWFGLDQADAARRRWGATATIVVVTEPVPVGAAVDDSVERREVPADLVPDGAIERVEDLVGAQAAVALTAGMPLTADLVVADPADRREHVAIRSEPGALPVRVGDEVAVWATFDPTLADPAGDGAATTRRIVEHAVVVTADDERIVVAVHPDDTAAVVEALVLATVSVVSVP